MVPIVDMCNVEKATYRTGPNLPNRSKSSSGVTLKLSWISQSPQNTWKLFTSDSLRRELYIENPG